MGLAGSSYYPWEGLNGLCFYVHVFYQKDLSTVHAERDHTMPHAPRSCIAHYPKTIDYFGHNSIPSLNDNKYYKDYRLT